MAAYTDTLGFPKGVPEFDYRGENCITRNEVLLDFDRIAKARSDAQAPALAAGDTLEVLHVPAGSQVLAGGLEVKKADAAAVTLSVDFLAAADLAAATAINGAVGTIASKALAAPLVTGAALAAGVIKVTIAGAAPTTGKVRVFCVVMNLRHV